MHKASQQAINKEGMENERAQFVWQKSGSLLGQTKAVHRCYDGNNKRRAIIIVDTINNCYITIDGDSFAPSNSILKAKAFVESILNEKTIAQ
jgi:hypothetical protein